MNCAQKSALSWTHWFRTRIIIVLEKMATGRHN